MALGAWRPALGSFAIGLGMGFTNTISVISVQSAVGYRQRGAATAGNLFMCLFGSVRGAALADALGWVFAGVLLFGVLTAVQSFRFPALAPGDTGERR